MVVVSISYVLMLYRPQIFDELPWGCYRLT
jgi:hypothetical protein